MSQNGKFNVDLFDLNNLKLMLICLPDSRIATAIEKYQLCIYFAIPAVQRNKGERDSDAVACETRSGEQTG